VLRDIDINRFFYYYIYKGANKKTTKEKERKESSLDREIIGLYIYDSL